MSKFADDILKMIDQGHKVTDIAKTLGCSPGHVWKVARKHDGPRRIRGSNLLEMRARSIAWKIESTKYELLRLEMEMLQIEEQRSRSHASR